MATRTTSIARAGRLAEELRPALMRTARRLRHERSDTADLGPGALSVLGALARSGPTSVGELAAFEGVRPPSMTRTIDCLVDAGYAVRRPHETDGRQVVVTLTEQGKAKIVADRRRRDAWLTVRLQELSAEELAALEAATPILQRISTA